MGKNTVLNSNPLVIGAWSNIKVIIVFPAFVFIASHRVAALREHGGHAEVIGAGSTTGWTRFQALQLLLLSRRVQILLTWTVDELVLASLGIFQQIQL